MAVGDRYDGRDTGSMEPRLPSCYGTGAVNECPGRCPHRGWCSLDYNGHAAEAGEDSRRRQ